MIAVAALFWAVTLNAAPPTLTSLFPAGARQGTTAEITALGIADTAGINGWASDKGITFRPTKDRKRFAVTIAPNVVPGVHHVRFYNADGASEQRPFIVGTLPEVIEVDPNDDVRKPQVLAGTSMFVNGRLNPMNDVDHYALDLKKGQTLVTSLLADSILKSPIDALLQILDANGNVLAENNDDVSLDPLIAFEVPRAGRYIVRVFAFPSKADSSIRFYGSELSVYRLTLTTNAFATHAVPNAVEANKSANVAVRGWNLPETLPNVGIKPIAHAESLPVTGIETGNPLFVRVEPHRCLIEMEPNDRSRPMPIDTPITISGAIDPGGDVDAFTVTLKKGEKRRIQVEARTLGSPLDAVLSIHGNGGKLPIEVDDVMKTADPETTFIAPADGTFRIELRDRFGHGGWRYFYRLRILPVEPEFTLTVAADQFGATAGDKVEVPVTITRLNAHAQPIELKAVDLPQGVEAAPVKIDGAAKAAKLVLTAGSKASSGVFRLAADGKPPIPVTATPAALGVKSDNFWLTVKPGKSKP